MNPPKLLPKEFLAKNVPFTDKELLLINEHMLEVITYIDMKNGFIEGYWDDYLDLVVLSLGISLDILSKNNRHLRLVK